MSFKGDEGLEGLDDALGDVILRKTHAQKKVLEQHQADLTTLKDELERMKRLLDQRVERDTYVRESSQLRVEASEATTLARDVRSQLSSQGPALRDELLKLLRDELAEGTTAQHALATSHSKVLAELQGSSSGHEGRLSAAESTVRSMDASQKERNSDFESRLSESVGSQEVKLASMQSDLAKAMAELEHAKEESGRAKAEQERLASTLVETRRLAAEQQQKQGREIEVLQAGMRSMQNTMQQYLGVEANAVAKFMTLRDSRRNSRTASPPAQTDALGSVDVEVASATGAAVATAPSAAVPRDSATANRESSRPFEVSGAYSASTPDRAMSPVAGRGDASSRGGALGGALAAFGAPPAAGVASTGGSTSAGALTRRVGDLAASLEHITREWRVYRSDLDKAREYLANERLAAEARQVSSAWNDGQNTGRLTKLEATMQSVAPITSIAEVEELRAELTRATGRLDELEKESEARHAAAREEASRRLSEQANELTRKIMARAEAAEAAASGNLHPVSLRLDEVADIAEAAKAAGEAAMRATQAEAGELRQLVREGIEKGREESETARGEDRRQWREELDNTRDTIGRDVTAVHREHGTALRELRLRLGACWEGMRESRVELGDAMQTLHHLVERAEIQHVVNQMLTRAAYNNLYYSGGTGGSTATRALVSPRVGLAESATSRAASLQPPHLPQALQHNHRRCLKRGECSCADRLATTLGAGDPRLALDRLFDRQLRLLMSVRHLWKQAEAARGELPHVPFLPPLPKAGGGAAAAAVAASQLHLRSGLRPPARGGGECGECAEDEDEEGEGGGVGAYQDGGVVSGSGMDEGGRLGPADGFRLPERLEDL